MVACRSRTLEDLRSRSAHPSLQPSPFASQPAAEAPAPSRPAWLGRASMAVDVARSSVAHNSRSRWVRSRSALRGTRLGQLRTVRANKLERRRGEAGGPPPPLARHLTRFAPSGRRSAAAPRRRVQSGPGCTRVVGMSIDRLAPPRPAPSPARWPWADARGTRKRLERACTCGAIDGCSSKGLHQPPLSRSADPTTRSDCGRTGHLDRSAQCRGRRATRR